MRNTNDDIRATPDARRVVSLDAARIGEAEDEFACADADEPEDTKPLSDELDVFLAAIERLCDLRLVVFDETLEHIVYGQRTIAELETRRR